MPNGMWAGSLRRSRLPSDWPQICALVFRTWGRICYLCGAYATEVDHVKPGDNHSLSNLRPICGDCHKRKSSAEGGRAAQAVKRSRRRQPEKHPGRIDG